MLNSLPKSYKFTLGDRIQNRLTNVLEGLIEAYYLPKEQKKILLKKIDIDLEVIRYLIRLGFDLGLYNSSKYKHYAGQLRTIGKMIGAWMKKI